MGLLSNLNIFNRHKKIERFMVGFFAITIPLVLMTFVSIYNKFGLDSEQLSAQAIYTTNMTFSRTGETASVVGIYTNQSKTRGMVLLQMSNSSRMSSKAEDYKVFTTAVDLKKRQEELLNNPTGSIYVFGNSGYVGLYFVDNKGFESQIYRSTLRLEKEFVVVDPNSISDEVSGTSYSKHDQSDVYFNLGAKNATVLKALDNENLSVQDLYIEAMGSDLDVSQREILAADLNSLSKLKLQIEEANSRLKNMSVDGVGLVVPELPDEIKSDTFSGSGQEIMMSTDFVYTGGLDFNWHNVTLENGYFSSIDNEQINPEKLTLARWLVKLKNELYNSRDRVSYEVEWVMSDGTSLQKFVNDLGLDNTAVSEMNKSVQNYQSLITEYMNLKHQYQTKDLRDLIALDITLTNATSNVDSISEEHFFMYE